MNTLSFDRVPADEHIPLESREMNAGQPLLLRYLNIVKRRKWLLAGCVVFAAVVGLIVTLLMTPQYTASTTLEIQRESYQIVNVRGVEPEARGIDPEFYETQWGLLRSEALAERVVTELRLQDDAAFFEMFGKSEFAEQIRERSAGAAGASKRQELVREAADILLENVEVSPARLSRLADISFTSPDPELSTRIANTWARMFIETSLERRYDATSYARKFLEERLEQLRQRLQVSERALVRYASNQRIINIPTATTTGTEQAPTTSERPLAAEDLSVLNRELNQATADRIAAQSRLRSSGNAVEALNNQAINELRTRRASLSSDYARLSAQFEPGYPPAKALADQIAEIDRALSREDGRIRSTLQATFDAASAREQMLRKRVSELESDLLNLRGRTIQYNIYQREVDTNRQLYDALLQRYKEIGIAGGVGVNNISIVDAAKLPERPSSPRLLLNLLASIVIGGILGAGAALALEQVDQTISDPREVENALGLPLLGSIPKTSGDDDPLEQLEDPKTALVEAYLSAQTRLAFTTDHGIPRTLAVTSTRPGEGKTTTAFALARQLARSTSRVILVDGDMRSPSLHHYLEIANDRGLSNYLSGEGDVASLVHAGPNGLFLLPAGPVPPNAAELLTGTRFATLMRELADQFDHVVVDAPPVMGLADTPLIGSVVEGAIFVIESHATSATMAAVAVDRMRESKARMLGALLTKFEAQKAQYGYGYGYEYGYGYGKNSDTLAEGV
jgi:capsular exopolysaccharide synthesis family protein